MQYQQCKTQYIDEWEGPILGFGVWGVAGELVGEGLAGGLSNINIT
jgi:hypothetical protein